MGAATLKVVLCCMFPISLPADTLPCGANWESGEEVSDIPRTFRWGVQRPNLLRYNRVEGFSIGVRAQFRPQSALGPISVTSTARLGLADLKPILRLDFTRETIQERITFSGFHELTAIDERAGHFNLGNSISALVAGRDDGDYYRRSGASLEWVHPTMEQSSLRIRAFGEYHRPATIETDFSIWGLIKDNLEWRPNIGADEGWFLGGSLEISSKWGTDPLFPRGGLLVSVEGAAGTAEYARADLLGSLDIPIFADTRISLEAGIGTSLGALPRQRLWYLGGPSTLRGVTPRALGGNKFFRVRGEVARSFSFGDVSLFSDGGWAPYSGTLGWDTDGPLFSIGSGLAVLDRLIHLDASWNLGDPGVFTGGRFRFHTYLDTVPF